jgi:hypothetical protein
LNPVWYFVFAAVGIMGVIVYARNRHKTPELHRAPPLTGSKSYFFDKQHGMCLVLGAYPNNRRETTLNLKLKNGDPWECTYLTSTIRPLDPVGAVCGKQPFQWTGMRWDDESPEAQHERQFITAEKKADELKAETREIKEHHQRNILEYLDTFLRGRGGGGGAMQQPQQKTPPG